MTSINQLPPPSSPSTSPSLPHNPDSIPASITPLSLPPEGIFESFDQLLNACQQHARLAGYAFTTAKSEKRDGTTCLGAVTFESITAPYYRRRY
jgi:hypothetical protein